MFAWFGQRVGVVGWVGGEVQTSGPALKARVFSTDTQKNSSKLYIGEWGPTLNSPSNSGKQKTLQNPQSLQNTQTLGSKNNISSQSRPLPDGLLKPRPTDVPHTLLNKLTRVGCVNLGPTL